MTGPFGPRLFTDSCVDSDEFDNKKFILAVQAEPTIWDSRLDSHSRRHERVLAWDRLSRIFDFEYDNKEHSGQNETVMSLQRRWKSLRDCFNRELSSRKKGIRKRHRKYIYANALSFLLPVVGQKAGVNKEIQDEHDDYFDSRDEQDNQSSRQSAPENEAMPLITEFIGLSEGTPDANSAEFEVLRPEQLFVKTEINASDDGEAGGDSILRQSLTTFAQKPNRDETQEPQKDTQYSQHSYTYNSPESCKTSIRRKLLEITKPTHQSVSKSPLSRKRKRVDSYERRINHDNSDKLFMLSLVPDLRKISQSLKLEMKADIINVIRKYKKRTIKILKTNENRKVSSFKRKSSKSAKTSAKQDPLSSSQSSCEEDYDEEDEDYLP